MMPERGKLPEWEREDNRAKIFLTLLRKPATFTELLSETGLARSTLSQHLKDLQQRQIIERAFEKGRRAYHITLDEQRMLSEIKRTSYDSILDVVSLVSEDFAALIETFISLLVKGLIYQRKKELIDGKKPSPEEMRMYYDRLKMPDTIPERRKEMSQQRLKQALRDFKNTLRDLGFG